MELSEGVPAFSLSPGERAGVRGKEAFVTRSRNNADWGIRP
jgi:hypothetical protein